MNAKIIVAILNTLKMYQIFFKFYFCCNKIYVHTKYFAVRKKKNTNKHCPHMCECVSEEVRLIANAYNKHMLMYQIEHKQLRTVDITTCDSFKNQQYVG